MAERRFRSRRGFRRRSARYREPDLELGDPTAERRDGASSLKDPGKDAQTPDAEIDVSRLEKAFQECARRLDAGLRGRRVVGPSFVNLVTARIGSGPVQIDREARTRSITLYGNLAGKTAGEADEEIMGFVRELGIGGEYEFAAVGQSKRMHETVEAIVFAFGLALVAIYMILAAQSNSFIHPFTIMLSAPLSFIGAFAALWISGVSLDIMGQIAFLMLMGIVMKNGILLVDYTNQ